MTNVEKRKNFLINGAFLTVIVLIGYLLFKFAFTYLMPFVVGFLIATILKPLVKQFDKIFGQNKVVSILVNIAFYIIVLLVLTWLVFRSIALVEYYIPIVERFINGTVLPMINDLLNWFEEMVQELNPEIVDVVNESISEIMTSLKGLVETFSKATLSRITGFVSSTPSILISILITVISSFFFSTDYQLVIDTFMKALPEKGRFLAKDIRYIFSVVIGKYFLAYLKLISLTFIELSIGFKILGINQAFLLAAIVAVVDIMPVLGTGTILIPWTLYELVLGDSTLGLGIFILYVIITVIRNILEPKIIGKEIGLHPLVTLISIFVGIKVFGFIGLFAVPIGVTILKTLHDEGKISIRGFFDGESGINPTTDLGVVDIPVKESVENTEEK